LRGTCIPAGHASAGLVQIIRALALRATQPRMTRRELVINLVAGAAPGMGRIFQGAHFFSHVLWSVWLAWALSLGLAAALLMPLGSRR